MVCSHRCSAEEGTSASLLPEMAEEVWNEPQNPQVLLHLHCGEHPDRLYHRLGQLFPSGYQANEQSEITHLHHTPTHTTCHAL